MRAADVLKSPVLLAVLCLALLAYAGPPARGEAGPLDRHDLVVIDPADQDKLIAADVPVIWKGSTFVLGDWDLKQQQVAAGLGIPFDVILPWLDERQELFLFEIHEDGEMPREWSTRVLFQKGREIVVAMDPDAAESWMSEGFHAVRVPRISRGWKRPVETFVPFTCSYNATVGALLGQTSQAQWTHWIKKVSGFESVVIGGTTYTIKTRNSPTMFTAPNTIAKGYDYALAQTQAWHYPAGNIEEDPFTGTSGTWKNLVLTIPGQTSPGEVVLMTGHLDSTSGSATTLAPGANDNGSGAATLLEVLRLFRQYRWQRTVKVIFFTGEEQGLYGSAAYVADHSMTGYLGVVNLDMFGYDGNGDNCFEIHAGTLSQSQDVGNCFKDSIASYGLGLTHDFETSTATNRSDHASFWNVNVGAIEIAENYFNDNLPGGCVGSDPNPSYHTVNDLWSNDQAASNVKLPYSYNIARTGMATLAAMAVPVAPCFASAPALTVSPANLAVDLSWTPVGGASSYRVFRSTTGCQGQWFETASTAGTSATDTNVTQGTTYSYYVEAVAADGFCVSAASNCGQGGPAYYHATPAGVTINDVCASGGPGHGNGVLEPGETAVLPVTLSNDGTIGLTSIAGTLSVTTPGVTVTDSSATWPNLGIGASAASNPDHFAVSVDRSTACNTAVSNTLALTYSNGSSSPTLPLTIGATGQTLLLDEGFSSGIPPTWTVVDGGAGGGAYATWTTANTGRTIGAPFSSPWAIVDSDKAGNAASQNEQLITPAFDASSCSQVVVEFSNQFRRYTGAQPEQADVDVSTNGGSSWTNVLRMQQSTGDDGYPTPNTKSVDITAAIAASPGTVKVRWHYYQGQYEYWWAIDNAKVKCFYGICNVCAAPGPPPGEPASLLVQRAGGNLQFSWTAPAGSCGTSAYALYRGELATLRSGGYNHGTALACAAGAGGFSLPANDPRLGAADYFLVVAENAGQEGSYGRNSSGLERPVSGAACRTMQNLSTCAP